MTLGLCSQRELDAAVAKAAKKVAVQADASGEVEEVEVALPKRDDREALIEELKAERQAAVKAAAEAAQEAEAEAWLEAKRAAEAESEG